MELSPGLIIGGTCGLVALVVFAALVVVALRWSKKSAAAWQEAAQRTGLTITKQNFPELHGRLDGVEVAADVFLQQAGVTGAGRSRSRGYTRVRAQLPAGLKEKMQVRSRRQRYGGETGLPPRTTGDAAFDAQYELYAPAGADLAALLPVEARAALRAAPLPVHIVGGAVLWCKLRVVRDAAELEQALRTCAGIAAAFR